MGGPPQGDPTAIAAAEQLLNGVFRLMTERNGVEDVCEK